MALPLNIELTDLERVARTLIETDRASTRHDAVEQCLRSALLACWSSAMPLNRWAAIACAIHDANPGSDAWAKGMTRLARRGVVRSYMKGGRRLYEVNL